MSIDKATRRELDDLHERSSTLDCVFVLDQDAGRSELFELIDSRLHQVESLLYFMGDSDRLGEDKDMDMYALWGVRLLAESARVMAYKLQRDEAMQEKPKLVRNKGGAV